MTPKDLAKLQMNVKAGDKKLRQSDNDFQSKIRTCKQCSSRKNNKCGISLKTITANRKCDYGFGVEIKYPTVSVDLSHSTVSKVQTPENEKISEPTPQNKHRIKIKPMSVNSQYKGRRFVTKEYKQWKAAALWLLPVIPVPVPPFELHLKYGLSSEKSDIDNPTKSVMDLLSSKYGFNDKLIRRLVIESEIVEKGSEYFEFELLHYCKEYQNNRNEHVI